MEVLVQMELIMMQVTDHARIAAATVRSATMNQLVPSAATISFYLAVNAKMVAKMVFSGVEMARQTGLVRPSAAMKTLPVQKVKTTEDAKTELGVEGHARSGNLRRLKVTIVRPPTTQAKASVATSAVIQMASPQSGVTPWIPAQDGNPATP